MPSITCPGCAHPIRYSDEHAGRSGRCKKCRTPVRLPPAREEGPDEGAVGRALAACLNRSGADADGGEEAERTLLLLTGSVCEGCFRPAPTQRTSFNYHIGAILLFFHGEVRGRLCRACINKYFSEYTMYTFFGGWWGMVSCVITPFVLLANVARYLPAIRLPYGPGEDRKDAVTPSLMLLLVFSPVLVPLVIVAAQAMAGR